MVAAGVYFMARVSFLLAPEVLQFIAISGAGMAALAGLCALAQTDIKKSLAYSTLAHLGIMGCAIGLGRPDLALMHMAMHAFFKATLFLGAGSVIHACHGEQDMRHMGGLKKYAPWTCIVLACASLAIAGFPGTSGFFSKDAILTAAYEHAPWMFWVGVVTAGMTAFYVWRAFWMTFWGEYRGHGKPHESPMVMLAPLMVLAVLAVLSLGGGFLFNVPEILKDMFPLKEEIPEEHMLMAISVAAGLIGIAMSWYMYVVNQELPGKIANALGGLYRLVDDKYRIDEAYDAAIVEPLIEGSSAVLWKTVDAGIIDGAVNGVGSQARGIGNVLKLIQSGNIRSYATWIVAGSVVIIIVMGIAGGVR
jgi:NADH-quinone oxidoreductase subunit L